MEQRVEAGRRSQLPLPPRSTFPSQQLTQLLGTLIFFRCPLAYSAPRPWINELAVSKLKLLAQIHEMHPHLDLSAQLQTATSRKGTRVGSIQLHW